MEVDSTDVTKIVDVLQRASTFFRRRDEMNAEVHMAREVRYSPLTSEVDATLDRVKRILENRVRIV